MCKSWCEAIAAVVILVFTLVPALWNMTASKWVIALAALVLLVHSFTCKSCFVGNVKMNPKSKKK